MSTTAAILREALAHDLIETDHIVTVVAADALATELAAALEALGYVIKKKPAPRKATEPSRPLVSQGDPALDEFIRTHHDPKYKPLPMPKSTFPGDTPRPLRVVLEEAIEAAKANKWPGSYTGNFAAPKTR